MINNSLNNQTEGNAPHTYNVESKEKENLFDNSDFVAGIPPSKLSFHDDRKEFKAKRKKIEKALSESPINPNLLKELARSEGGLLSDDLRKTAWPLMLGITDMTSPPAPSESELLSHPEYEQVVLDVNRSLKRFPPGIPLEQRLSLQNQLTNLILRVVITHPHLRYYQGYHDVAVTLLLVTGENPAFFILEYLSINHLKECMEATMEKTQLLLSYMYPLIRKQNKRTFEHMEKSGVATMFALPWFLTWFGHSLHSYKDVVRLYDYFLASEPLAPVYLSSVIVVHQSEEILRTPCDMASLHSLLSHIPDDLPFEKLLKKTSDLYNKYPPKSIEREVLQRAKEEQNQRQMELAIRQRRMAKNAPVIWRWLNHIDPIRRFPLFGLPQQHIPGTLRRVQYLMFTAVAVGMYAYYLRSVEP